MEKYLLTTLSRQAYHQEEMIKQVTMWNKGFRGGNIAQQAKNLLTIVKKSQDKILKLICLWERSRSKNGKHWE